MAHTITGKLNKAAIQFQAGESTGFGLRLGVKFYDRATKADAWTNFEAVVFAKAPAQVKFYQDALVEGAIVEISGDKLAIKQFQGQNGLSLSIELIDAKLGFVHAPNQQLQQQPQRQAQQQAMPAWGVNATNTTSTQQPMPQQQQPQQYDNYGRPIQQMPQQRPQQRSQLEQQLPEFHDDIPF